MRCTNKWNRLVPLLAAFVLFCTGCGQEPYQLAYDPDSPVTAFQVTSNEIAAAADGFAVNLCVTAGDVDIASLDMGDAGAAGLFDINNKDVMYAKNVHEQLYPASLTKIMTALVALKHGNPEDIITATANVRITESGATLCGLKEGDKLTLDQALHALLMNSANDAGVAIAEHIGGSVEGFAEMMNEEARAIGATNSHFVNPHGLQDEAHYTTAYDLYLIFNEVMQFERFSEIIQMTSYTSTYTDKDGNAKELKCESTNQYLKGNAAMPENVTVLGGKTGTTSAAGNCLILLSKDASGNPFISVILRSSDRQVLYTQMTGLLEQIKK